MVGGSRWGCGVLAPQRGVAESRRAPEQYVVALAPLPQAPGGGFSKAGMSAAAMSQLSPSVLGVTAVPGKAACSSSVEPVA